MPTSAYWQKRFSDLENAQNKSAQNTFHQIEPAFDKAQSQIQSQIETWYNRYATNNGITMAEARKQLSAAELKELKWDVQDYIKYGRENAVNGQWMKELENASARYHISRLEALQLRSQQSLEVAFGNELDSVDGMVRNLYQSGYYHTIFEVQKGFGIGWEVGQINQKKLQTVINRPWAADGKNFSDRIWQSKTQMVNELYQEMTRTIIQGKAPDEAIKSMTKYLQDKTKNAKYKAGRLVMTEQAFISSAAQKDAFNALDVEEFEIVATLDSHTSEICQEMDGKHFPMKDFEPGVTAPPFHVWCRSCTCPYFNDEWSGGERAARGEDGKTYYVPADMTYPEWKQSMVDGQTDGLQKIPSIEDLEKQFSDLTDGYAYDDFMNDFGSIEDGFEGADVEDMNKAKSISEQIEALRSVGGQPLDTNAIRTKQKPIDELESLGISFKDTSKEPISDEIVSKFSDFISNFEQTHSAFFNINEVQLQSISVVDDLVAKGTTAAGAYYPKSQSITLMKKSIVNKPTSKLMTYSNSDDYQIHFLSHEYGHYIADSLEKTLSVKDSDIIQNVMLKYFDGDIFKTKTSNLVDVLSSYGAKTPQEAFAEAFAEAYTCEEPREFAKIFKEELEDILKKRH